MRNPLHEIQTNKLISTTDLQILNEELSYASRLFNDILQKHKSQVKVLLEMEDEISQDENEEVHSFTKIGEDLANERYHSVTEVISDMRCTIEKCYKSYGFYSYEGKQAKVIEQIMEQKLNLLPRVIREKCTIQATNEVRKKEYLNHIFEGSRRKSGGSNTFGQSETLIMMQLEHEAHILTENLKKEKQEAKRIEEENNLKRLQQFEENVLPKTTAWSDIKTSWQLPCVGLFICMCRDLLNIHKFNYTEFELASIFIDKSMLFRRIFTALLATPYQRNCSGFPKLLTYEEWSEKLGFKASNWFKTYKKQGANKVFAKYGIGENVFLQVGEITADEKDWYKHLSLNKRMAILQALCEAVVYEDADVCKQLTKIPVLKRQEMYIGEDERCAYYFFPQFADTDIRVYRCLLNNNHKSSTISDQTEGECVSWERVCWDLASLSELIDQVKEIKKSKQSNSYFLQETLETLYEELSKREGSFLKDAVKGKLSVATDYYK